MSEKSEPVIEEKKKLTAQEIVAEALIRKIDQNDDLKERVKHLEQENSELKQKLAALTSQELTIKE